MENSAAVQEMARDLAAYRYREAAYLHVIREVAFRISDADLEEMIAPVRDLLVSVREDGATNGLHAFFKAR